MAHPSRAILPEIPREAVLGQLERILASKLFVNANRMSTFLRHIITETLAGRAGNLKEYQLGVDVFGRGPDYDSRVDPVVRVEARQLRFKLDAYYKEFGTLDEIIITVPKGAYVPRFERRELPVPEPETRPDRRMPDFRIAIGAAAVLLVLAGAWFVYRRESHPNAKAAEAYRLGQFHWSRRTRESLLKAVDSFRQCTAADPNFAPCYAYLADSCGIMSDYDDFLDPKLVELGRSAARRAIQLAPGNAEAHSALAWILFTADRDWAAAEPEFRRAIQLAPNNVLAHQRYGNALTSRGRFDEAETELNRALQLDPVSLSAMVNLAELYYYSRQFDKEEAQLQHVLELNPSFVVARAMMVNAKIAAGRGQEAVATGKKLLSLPETANWCQLVTTAYARAGMREEALQHAASCSPQPITPTTYVFLGDAGRAIDVLEQRLRQRDPYLRYLPVEPEYEPLHGEPRFERLLHEINSPLN